MLMIATIAAFAGESCAERCKGARSDLAGDQMKDDVMDDMHGGSQRHLSKQGQTSISGISDNKLLRLLRGIRYVRRADVTI
jgi:hypothetical protein